jgi:hypothetical protein
MQEQNTTREEWRHIPGFGGYLVSSFGRVLTYRSRGISEMRQHMDKGGYLYVSILDDQDRKRGMKVHALVLLAFRGGRPPGWQAAHFDGNKANNRPDNLRWVTPKENAADKERHGRTSRGNAHSEACKKNSAKGHRNGHSTLTGDDVSNIRTRYANGEKQTNLAIEYDVTQSCISAVVLRKTWTHID